MDDFEREGLLTCLFFWKSIPCGTNIAIKSVFFFALLCIRFIRKGHVNNTKQLPNSNVLEKVISRAGRHNLH